MPKRDRKQALPVEAPSAAPPGKVQKQLQLFFGQTKYELRSESGRVVNSGPATPRAMAIGPFAVSALKSEEPVPMPTDIFM
jgi:hypothetical protein